MRPPSARRRLAVRPLEDRLTPSTFTVTSTADAGAGSLRAAILAANAHSGADAIAFNIPGGGVHTISPVSALPAVTGPLVIDGATQPGFAGNPLIELTGAGAGAGATGLAVPGGSVVRALVVNRFAADGIRVRGSNTRVEGCFVGTTAAGTAPAPNGAYGVRVFLGADHVVVGGTAAGTGNVISGNGKAGVLVQGVGTTGTQVVGNLIGLNPAGTAAVANKVGVWVTGGAATTAITGNTISGNVGPGVAVTGTGTAGATVADNRIGTDPAGGAARANGSDGVLVASGARSVVVAGNVLSGNAGNGVSIAGAAKTVVRGNRIGLNAAGTAALANAQDGVLVAGGATRTTVGGPLAADRNLIGGNLGNGVEAAGGTGNLVVGNYIGTDATGTLGRGNSLAGVRVGGGTVVGGTAAGAGNLISGNGGAGVELAGSGNTVLGNRIGTDAPGTAALGNSGAGVLVGGDNNLVGGTTAAARNVVAGNAGFGVDAGRGTGNLVQGNFIGTDAGGTAALGNTAGGVHVGGSKNVIGGTAAGARNVVSANGGPGVEIDGFGTQGNQVQGNFIGTDVTGALDRGNALAGVLLMGETSNNVVGGTAAGARNVISGNTGPGVEIDGQQDLGTSSKGNRVEGNFIGTDAAGTGGVGNGGGGVVLGGTIGNFVGGTAAGARNVISGNVGVGVDLVGLMLVNRVEGNYIGTDATGLGALPNTGAGVRIAGGPSVSVPGGQNTVAGNVIAGNGDSGVLITGDMTLNNRVVGNRIGVGADGVTALGNGRHGVFLTGSTAGDAVGGTSAGEGNVIAHNGGAGVLVGTDAAAGFTTPAGTGNTVSANSIFANGGLGIDLGAFGAVTANDAGDADGGPNDLQNFPVLTAVLLDGSDLLVLGTINTTPGAHVRVEFFASPAADPSGNGEGQTYLGFADVTVGAGGTVGFSAAFTTGLVHPGDVITATATVGGDTSEFSAALAVT